MLPGEKELVENSEPNPPEHLIESWVAARPDLQGLPLRLDDSCKLAPQDAATLMNVSRMSLGVRMRLGSSSMPDDMRAQQINTAATTLVEDTSALVQVLQCEDEQLRVRMVKLLSMKDDAESQAALADRALFDLSPEVRALAIHMLKLSPVEAVQEKLLAGFDYAWEPVAVNAANALVELDEDGVSLEDLRKKLNVPDPHAPYKGDDGQWKIRELVRVNHLRNCLLCHAPVVEKKTNFQAIVPEPGKKLPRVYYGEGSPSVRPDVTYVVQDFSVMHELKDQKPWPDRQRFDYFIRERALGETEAIRLREEVARDEPIRHRAIRYAIQQLSARRNDETPEETSLAVR